MVSEDRSIGGLPAAVRMALAPGWTGEVGVALAWTQAPVAADAGPMTHGMVLGAGVLIATQAILVVVAVLWYLRTRDRGDAPASPPRMAKAAGPRRREP